MQTIQSLYMRDVLTSKQQESTWQSKVGLLDAQCCAMAGFERENDDHASWHKQRPCQCMCTQQFAWLVCPCYSKLLVVNDGPLHQDLFYA